MTINRTKNMRGILDMFNVSNLTENNHKPGCTCLFCNKDDDKVEDEDNDNNEDDSEDVKESNELSTMGSGPTDAGWEKNGGNPRNFKMNNGVKNNSVAFGDDKDGIYEEDLDEESQSELDRLINVARYQIDEQRKIVMKRPVKSSHLKD